MNLLTIDTNTVASLATHTWRFANGVTTCTFYTLYPAESAHPSPSSSSIFSFPPFFHLLCLSVYLNPSKSANSTKFSDYRSQYVVWNVGYQCLCGYSLCTAQYAFDMASRQTDLS